MVYTLVGISGAYDTAFLLKIIPSLGSTDFSYAWFSCYFMAPSSLSLKPIFTSPSKIISSQNKAHECIYEHKTLRAQQGKIRMPGILSEITKYKKTQEDITHKELEVNQ